MELPTEIQRLPAGLWESLQTTCYRHDLKFIQDAARLLGVPVGDLKKRVLGTRGIPVAVTVSNSPWWEGKMCPIMECDDGGMWRQCGALCEAHGTCWDHRTYKRNTCKYKLVGDPYFETLEKRWPMTLVEELVCVTDDGLVYDDAGELKEGLRIDRVKKIASYGVGFSN